MKLTKTQILSLFDTLISKTLYLGSSFFKRIDEAQRYNQDTIEILPFQLENISQIKNSDNFKWSLLIGYPLGIESTNAKLYEIEKSLEFAIDEIVLMPNLCWLKDGEYEKIRKELSIIKEKVRIPVKVILNNILITREEFEKLAQITENMGIILIHSYENLNVEKEKTKSKFIRQTNFNGQLVRVKLRNKEIITEKISGFDTIFRGRNINSGYLWKNNIFQYNSFDFLNKIIITPGTLAGSGISASSVLSVGFKSPMNEGIKNLELECLFSDRLMACGIKSLVIDEIADELSIIYIAKDRIEIIPTPEYEKMDISILFENIRQEYGDVSIIGIGPCGEEKFISSTIVATDHEGNPAIMPSRGSGIGAIFGSKKIKAVIIENIKQNSFFSEKENKLINSFEEHLIENTISGRMLPRHSTMGFFEVNNMLSCLPCENYRKSSLDNSIIKNIMDDFKSKFDLTRSENNIVRFFNKQKNKFRNINYIDFAGLALVNGIYDIDIFLDLYEWCFEKGVDPIEIGGAFAVANEAGIITSNGLNSDFLDNIFENDDWRTKVILQGGAIASKTLGIGRAPVINGEVMLPYDIRSMVLSGIAQKNGISNDESNNFSQSYYYSFRDISNIEDKLEEININMEHLSTALNVLGLSRYCIFAFLKNTKMFNLVIDTINSLYNSKLLSGDILKISRQVLKSEQKFNNKCGLYYNYNIPSFFREEQNSKGNIFKY
ncbi:MAG: hypothetical protein M0R46_05225 [Candidatus Muirbacterium halophilum]|nr:hypothetical protein [Candidatus Muirbacterium halophilum]MCK9475296.1 hypothetical protein [Candidatus Muirbacterium halophilum]